MSPPAQAERLTSCRHGAFTLVELLVTITIIAVLLAMLTPAMDGAIYQAQLAVCSASLDSIATGATAYALTFQRKYPHRPGLNVTGKPDQLTDVWAGGQAAGFDDRPIIRDYITLDALNDPLCDKLRLDPDDTDENSAYVYSAVHLWYGFRYTTPGGAGMMKLGDRLEWSGVNQFNRDTTWSGELLAGDRDMVSQSEGGSHGSHPDGENKMRLVTLRNQTETPGTLGLGLDAGFNYVFSRWQLNDDHRRGKLDLSYAFANGAVVRITHVPWDEEERVTSVPEFGDGSKGGKFWVNVPR